jgi:uncharacterized protein
VILLDTSGLLAAIDASQRDHAAAARILAAGEPRILSPFVLAELDYLLTTRVGQHAELLFLEEVAIGAYRLESVSAEDIRAAREVVKQYAKLEVGLADASIVVLAHRYDCHDVLTLDARHFRVISRPKRPFRLLPLDEIDG